MGAKLGGKAKGGGVGFRLSVSPFIFLPVLYCRKSFLVATENRQTSERKREK